MNGNGEKGLDSLLVWQKAVEYSVQISNRILPILPIDEKYALTAQLRRSAQSVPANIAEGYGRFYYQEGIRFCYIARGSLSETYSHMTLAYRLGYLSEGQFNEFVQSTQDLHKLLNGYIAFLKRSRRGLNEPGNNVVRENAIPYDFEDQDPTSDIDLFRIDRNPDKPFLES